MMNMVTSLSGLPYKKQRWLFTEEQLVFILIFLVLPLFDMANGVLVVRKIISEGGFASPSQLGRLCGTLLLLWICFRQKISIMPWVLIALYLIPVELYAGFIHQEPIAVLFGFVSSYKVLYLVVVCMVLNNSLQTKEQAHLFGKYLKLNLILISGSLIFSQITGLGNSTYGYGFGTKGFFSSGNGIGVYMGVCSLLLFSLYRYKVYTNISHIWFIVFAVATALIGTKTAMLFSLLQIVVIMWYSRFRIIWIVLLLIAAVSLLPTAIDVLSVVFDIVLKRYQASDDLVTFLGSGRIGYVQDALDVFNEQKLYAMRMVFGSGSFLSFQDPRFVVQYDTLETDLFDVLFMYGIIGVLLYLSFLISIAVRLFRYPLLLLSFFLLFFHSIIAGHVLFNGQSSTALAMFFAVAIYMKRRRGMALAEKTN